MEITQESNEHRKLIKLLELEDSIVIPLPYPRTSKPNFRYSLNETSIVIAVADRLNYGIAVIDSQIANSIKFLSDGTLEDVLNLYEEETRRIIIAHQKKYYGESPEIEEVIDNLDKIQKKFEMDDGTRSNLAMWDNEYRKIEFNSNNKVYFREIKNSRDIYHLSLAFSKINSLKIYKNVNMIPRPYSTKTI